MPSAGFWDVAAEAAARSLGSDWPSVVAAIQADPAFVAGDEIRFQPGAYTTGAAIELTRPCRLTGNGAVITTGSGYAAIDVKSSDVLVQGMRLVMPGASYVAASYGVRAVAPSWSQLYKRITIDAVVVDACPWIAFEVAYVADPTIIGCQVNAAVNAGIRMLSVSGFRIERNEIYNITRTGYTPQAVYGITVTGIETTDITTHPHSRDGWITDNLVKDNPHYVGINTHGTQRTHIAGNIVKGCLHAIDVVARDGENDQQYDGGAPTQTTITGNAVDSNVTGGQYGSGIRVGGASNTSGVLLQPATGLIDGNAVRWHGQDISTPTHFGAIYVGSTRGMVISNNVIEESARTAIRMNHNNDGYVITGNTILGVWSTLSYTSCVHVPGNNNTGLITGNMHRVTSLHTGATYKDQAFIRHGSTITGSSTDLGTNSHQCASNVLNLP